MKNLKSKVKKYLERSEFLRNDRNQLLNIIGLEEGLTSEESLLISKHYKLFANVDRYFRLVQQQNPELRGSDWSKRQKMSEDKMRELGYNVG